MYEIQHSMLVKTFINLTFVTFGRNAC